MALSQIQKITLLALLAAALALSAIVLFGQGEREISVSEFSGQVLSSGRFAVQMDIRGLSTPEAKQAVLQCGVDITSSLGLLGKNDTTAFAFEGETCVQSEKTSTIKECEDLSRGAVIFHITGGSNGTKFYYKRAEIQVPSFYYGTCKLALANSTAR